MDKIDQFVGSLGVESPLTLGTLKRRYCVSVLAVTLVLAFAALWIFNSLGASVRPNYFELVQHPLVAMKQASRGAVISEHASVGGGPSYFSRASARDASPIDERPQKLSDSR